MLLWSILVYFGPRKVHSIWSDWSVFILAHSQKLSSMDEPIVRCSFQHFYELFAAISVIHGTGSRAKWFCIVLHSEYVNICQRSRGVCEHEGPRDNHLQQKGWPVVTDWSQNDTTWINLWHNHDQSWSTISNNSQCHTAIHLQQSAVLLCITQHGSQCHPALDPQGEMRQRPAREDEWMGVPQSQNVTRCHKMSQSQVPGTGSTQRSCDHPPAFHSSVNIWPPKNVLANSKCSHWSTRAEWGMDVWRDFVKWMETNLRWNR